MASHGSEQGETGAKRARNTHLAVVRRGAATGQPRIVGRAGWHYGQKRAIMALNTPGKGMAFLRRLTKVAKTMSKPHVYLADKWAIMS